MWTKKNISRLSDDEISRVKELLKKHGIKINSIGSPIGKIALDEDLDAHMKLAEGVFKIANTLDAHYVRMFSFYPPKGKEITHCRKEVLEALEALLNLADSYGITLCHENEGESPESCLDLLTHFGGRLKAVFDMGNFTAGDAKIKEILTDYNGDTSNTTFVTLEPHLQDFAGLSALTASKLNLPYRYETPQAAFTDAVAKIKEILK